RIVDRARRLESDREESTHEKKVATIDWELKVIFRRARHINAAITLCTASALFTTMVVTLLFASEFVPMSVGGIIAILFVTSMACLSTAFLVFLLEVRIATNALRIGSHRTR